MPFPNVEAERMLGKSQSPLERAVRRIREIVGDAHVTIREADVNRYSNDTIPWQRICSAVVFPGSAQEVSQIMRAANEFKLRVWPFSKGKNWGYGATIAAHDGAVILVLERMNKIHQVDPELAYAVIEPGVTQKQLNNHLKENQFALWADCTDSTPEGSVLGNALERGVGYTPYGDHFGHLCGLEVVLPDGEIIQTGGAPLNAPAWHTYKWGTGPYVEGLFSQSNLGVVTKAGIWLMPEPECFNCFVCEVSQEQDVGNVVDAIRRLALSGTVRCNIHMVNDLLFLSLLMQYPYDRLKGQTHIPSDMQCSLRKEFGIAPWTLTGGIYGTNGHVRAGRRHVKKELAGFGKLTFLDDRSIAMIPAIAGFYQKLSGTPILSALGTFIKNRLLSPSPLEVINVIPHVYPILKGIPGEYIVSCAYFKSRRGRRRTDIDPARDDCGLIWFAPMVPLTGRHTTSVLEMCKPVFERHGIDFSISFIVVNPRSVVMLMEIFYDKESAHEAERANALYDELCELTMRAGYQQYRTSVAQMDRILACNPGYQRMMDQVKSALDPNHVLAPGRYGVAVTKE